MLTKAGLHPSDLQPEVRYLLSNSPKVLGDSSEVLSDGPLVLIESGVNILLHIGEFFL